MSCVLRFVAVVLVADFVAGSAVLGQSALDQLERRLDEVVAPQPPSSDRSPGYLGMFADEVEGSSGVRVVSVAQDGPAEIAGLKPGDRIIAVDGNVIAG